MSEFGRAVLDHSKGNVNWDYLEKFKENVDDQGSDDDDIIGGPSMSLHNGSDNSIQVHPRKPVKLIPLNLPPRFQDKNLRCSDKEVQTIKLVETSPKATSSNLPPRFQDKPCCNDKEIIEFFKNILESKGSCPLQNLTGYLSQLTSSAKNKNLGISKDYMKQLFLDNDHIFSIDKKETVRLVNYNMDDDENIDNNSDGWTHVQYKASKSTRSKLPPQLTYGKQVQGSRSAGGTRTVQTARIVKGIVQNILPGNGFIRPDSDFNLGGNIYFGKNAVCDVDVKSDKMRLDELFKIGTRVEASVIPATKSGVTLRWEAERIWKDTSREGSVCSDADNSGRQCKLRRHSSKGTLNQLKSSRDSSLIRQGSYSSVSSIGSTSVFSDVPRVVKGVVQNVFPSNGFIEPDDEYGLNGNVFFHKNVCAVDGDSVGKDGLKGIFEIGDRVMARVIRTEKVGIKVKWKATAVWKDDSSQCSAMDDGTKSSLSQSSVNGRFSAASLESSNVFGEGTITKLLDSFGFIKGDSEKQSNRKNEIFFHFRTVKNVPVGKSVKNVLSVGQRVKFDSIPSTKPDKKGKLEAAHVWIITESLETDKAKGQETDVEDDVYYSSSSTEDKEELHKISSNQEIDNEHPNVNGILWNAREKLLNQKGKIYPTSNREAKIKFGTKDAEEAFAILEVVYLDDNAVDDLLWTVDDGQVVTFNAIGDPDCPAGFWWKATCVSLGGKPTKQNLSDAVHNEKLWDELLVLYRNAEHVKANIKVDSVQKQGNTSVDVKDTACSIADEKGSSESEAKSVSRDESLCLEDKTVVYFKKYSGKVGTITTVEKFHIRIKATGWKKTEHVQWDYIYVDGKNAKDCYDSLQKVLKRLEMINFSCIYVSEQDDQNSLLEKFVAVAWIGKKPKNARERTVEEFYSNRKKYTKNAIVAIPFASEVKLSLNEPSESENDFLEAEAAKLDDVQDGSEMENSNESLLLEENYYSGNTSQDDVPYSVFNPNVQPEFKSLCDKSLNSDVEDSSIVQYSNWTATVSDWSVPVDAQEPSTFEDALSAPVKSSYLCKSSCSESSLSDDENVNDSINKQLKRKRTRRKRRRKKSANIVDNFGAPESNSNEQEVANVNESSITNTALVHVGSIVINIEHTAKNEEQDNMHVKQTIAANPLASLKTESDAALHTNTEDGQLGAECVPPEAEALTLVENTHLEKGAELISSVQENFSEVVLWDIVLHKFLPKFTQKVLDLVSCPSDDKLVECIVQEASKSCLPYLQTAKILSDLEVLQNQGKKEHCILKQKDDCSKICGPDSDLPSSQRFEGAQMSLPQSDVLITCDKGTQITQDANDVNCSEAKTKVILDQVKVVKDGCSQTYSTGYIMSQEIYVE